MSISSLDAISPLDGRYGSKTSALRPYFSEAALMRYRVWVEVEYFIALCELPLPALAAVDPEKFQLLRTLYQNFQKEDAQQIKAIESTTNHDVKAIEYFIKTKLDEIGLDEFKEFIHFGLTSQDINNTAIPLSIQQALKDVYFPLLQELLDKLQSLSDEWSTIPMLARTHGQSASPTRLGKEIEVFLVRIKAQLNLLNQIPYSAKFGGATGNMNAHVVVYPQIDWNQFANSFVQNRLGLHRSFPTTQIEHYDNLAALFDNLKRINTIVIDLNRDLWSYISMDYFKQEIAKDEVGSSAMPHKVNPIDFENSEGNLGLANAIFEHLSNKLPVSRLQRDLTDSTVLRNVGVPIGHTLVALKSTIKGLGKLRLNRVAIERDLENNWAVVSEAIQTILRREQYPNPYEALKALTRTGSAINKQTLQEFIEGLSVSEDVKKELRAISPQNYTGL
ncbi:MAG: adenylosuccinate lyase [Bacteroidetes bacterium]|nr:adenylosuccinate lyase [Bacteroidota bacterium]MDA0878877.1 adenylosuccinate lyase [Bacteroidota bacterium]MDA1115135.1 adenylosuccinate lyase [Bacteroidota bacterium]